MTTWGRAPRAPALAVGGVSEGLVEMLAIEPLLDIFRVEVTRPRAATDPAWKVRATAAMDRYACGEEAAFAELYELLGPRLHSFLWRRTRDQARTEDLVQQTFLQMHAARCHFTPGSSVTAWAFAIARRLLIDQHRKSGREFPEEEREGGEARERVDPGVLPDEASAQRRLARRVEQELARLPAAQRTAFELVQRDGLSTEEAAEVLGATAIAVRLRVHRARATLRKAMGDLVRGELGEEP